jgi:hypothetical protein
MLGDIIIMLVLVALLDWPIAAALVILLRANLSSSGEQ